MDKGENNFNEEIAQQEKERKRIAEYKSNYDFASLFRGIDKCDSIYGELEIYKRFKEHLTIYASKPRRLFYDKSAYDLIISTIENAKNKSMPKKINAYHLIKQYTIIDVLSQKLLIEKLEAPDAPIRYYAYIEQIFKIIHETHLYIGHYGINATDLAIGAKFANVPRELITFYIENCGPCLKKKTRASRNGLTFKPMISACFKSRGQVDLIDFQSNPDGEYKWVFHYQDHSTKYSFLRALKSKCAAEVAHHLFLIFIDFGAPMVK